ncbi:PD-(D/E)XK nuclease family protein [Vagococcus vulneris]|uniref:Uncharacterized protein n=1 Tax=Vagococcus vulneris TaxID=1977869 RepID=A0A429ZX00_9ENTE|nr:PD-(D/E)XK nuclease family protein [Vagococcus vulneris]RST98186.1 hypothetical protein CBF37_08435 [Vagococcus vulneris]
MSIQFIIGTGERDHTGTALRQAVKWLEESENHEVYYLVPNHVKFETEVSVLRRLSKLPEYAALDNMASTRLQVFSLSRLAWYKMQYTPRYQQKRLSDAGKFMLIRQVLLEIEMELQIFRYEINKTGFIEQLVAMFDEYQLGNITSEDLLDAVEQFDGASHVNDSKEKLLEIQKIYECYQKKLIAINGETSDILLDLTEYLSQIDLTNVMVIIGGYSSLTAVEQQLMQRLMSAAGEWRMNLIVDKSYGIESPIQQSLFYNPGKVYFDLYQYARHKKIPILVDALADMPKIHEDMTLIGNVWYDAHQMTADKKLSKLNHSESLQIWACDDAYGEAVMVAKKIRQLIIAGYHYKDIKIMTRDLTSYRRVLEPVFTQAEIPFYINEDVEMKHHPLIEFIDSLFQINMYYYRYSDLMRLLRTELFMPELTDVKELDSWESGVSILRQRIDYTENVVLAYGYNGFYWTQESDWSYVTYEYNGQEVSTNCDMLIQDESNKVRQSIRDHLCPFFESLATAETYRQASVIFYQFLINVGVQHQLVMLREQAINQGDLVSAKNHEQAWQALVDLLDELVDLMGDNLFILEDFIQIIHSGLEGQTFSKVPAALDQLIVTSVDMVQAERSRVTFMLGVSDQDYPKKIENKTLMTDDERQMLAEYLSIEKYLKKDTTSEFAREPYVFYLALLSATEQLIITYPQASDTVKEIKASSYLRPIIRNLQLNIETKNTPITIKNMDNINYFATYKLLLSDIMPLKREAIDSKQPLSWLWQQLEKRLIDKLPFIANRVLASSDYKNIPDDLTQESVASLYGDTIYASVSKIENFNQCHYKYFLQYGLKLKEREKFELSSAATGDFFHDSLDQFFKELIKQKKQLSELSDEEINYLAESVLAGVFAEAKFSILTSSQRLNYIRYQLSQTIKRVIWSLRKQSERTKMTTLQTEILFGEALGEKGLASLDFDLPHQKKLSVRGKIDRLDMVTVDNQPYLAVVDYKSSQHSFSMSDAYYGLALQMITYLDVALQNAVNLVGQRAEAAGAFYLHVQNPTLKEASQLTNEKIELELLKEFKYQGILVQNDDLLTELDVTVEPTKASLVYPFNQLKSGEAKSKQFVTPDDLQLLIQHNHQQFITAGEKIYEGKTTLNPMYKGKERIACRFCPFRSVCQFDAMLPDNNYHRIEELQDDIVLGRLKLGKGETTDGSNTSETE